MYRVAVTKDLISQHYLVGGEWGAENTPHSHHYRIELILEGAELDQHGFLVNILDIQNALDALISRYADQTLNDLPEFAAANPSVERFASILCQSLAAHIQAHNLLSITVKLWENEFAWASSSIHLGNPS
jgi:6-pyruvoyltetrahydropterin/6-carboxytetrahydropterin synthase